MKAFIFPGQGSQYTGMGKEIYGSHQKARDLFQQANLILGFDISRIMFEGSSDDLKQTRVTQPAIFIHSVALAHTSNLVPDVVAGHSLGEFSALVVNGTLPYDECLRLVSIRAQAMQEACEKNPSTMAAILGLPDAVVEEICLSIQDDVVVAANYNSPNQLVISGTTTGVQKACEKLKQAGAKRTVLLPVGGAFHSPIMNAARKQLTQAIENMNFQSPRCPIYQNVTATAETDSKIIKTNLIKQLTNPVRWTQTVQNMIHDGTTHFFECGPGKVLQGLVKKINSQVSTDSI